MNSITAFAIPGHGDMEELGETAFMCIRHSSDTESGAVFVGIPILTSMVKWFSGVLSTNASPTALMRNTQKYFKTNFLKGYGDESQSESSPNFARIETDFDSLDAKKFGYMYGRFLAIIITKMDFILESDENTNITSTLMQKLIQLSAFFEIQLTACIACSVTKWETHTQRDLDAQTRRHRILVKALPRYNVYSKWGRNDVLQAIHAK